MNRFQQLKSRAAPLIGFTYSKEMDSEASLCERYAHHFPVRNRLVYLNHAAVAPLCKPAADAMKYLADDCANFGSLHYPEWLAAYDGVRDAAARLTGAQASEIALVKNTSEGIATVAMGLDWKAGDRIVGFREEFPANLYPWKRLRKRRVCTSRGFPCSIRSTASTRRARARGCSPSASWDS